MLDSVPNSPSETVHLQKMEEFRFLIALLLTSSSVLLQGEVDESVDGVIEPALPSDAEFEDIGDYEEGFLSEWWQEPRSKGDKGDEGIDHKTEGLIVHFHCSFLPVSPTLCFITVCCLISLACLFLVCSY